jgi:hypothetical protein
MDGAAGGGVDEGDADQGVVDVVVGVKGVVNDAALAASPVVGKFRVSEDDAGGVWVGADVARDAGVVCGAVGVEEDVGEERVVGWLLLFVSMTPEEPLAA